MSAEQKRREAAFQVRVDAAQQARDVGYSYRVNDEILGETLPQPVVHQDNGDEQIRLVPMSYTKGLPHDVYTGLVASEDSFDLFVRGINSGSPFDFKATPLGPAATPANPRVLTQESDWLSRRGKGLLATARASRPDSDIVRAWEAAGAGLNFDVEGPDAQAVTMPPAPPLGSDELTAEMAEVYLQAALRDLPFAHFDMSNATFSAAVAALNQIPYFQDRRRRYVDNGLTGAAVNASNAFRGIFRGDTIGPYMSQFMLIGNTGINGNDFEHGVEEGLITYGALTIDQRVRNAANINYMVDFNEWLDVQNGADFRGLEQYVPASGRNGRKFISQPRDLATYVHYDALYEAYLNACLILLGAGAAFDPGIPFQQPDFRDHQQGFALYGGPHILTLVTEVATRALKAVRYQKFDVHRRCRPEVLAGRLEKLPALQAVLDPDTFAKFQKMDADIDRAGIYGLMNATAQGSTNKLLPMAFVEGSPMHPAYGAGHATVAGACTTILKAWFDTDRYFDYQQAGKSWRVNFSATPPARQIAFQAQPNGRKLQTLALTQNLTVEGELNKCAANISIGRDWAGVHYYTDYSQSMIMGEEIAIKLLQEQSITYLPDDNLSMTLSKFDGTKIKIQNGEILPM